MGSSLISSQSCERATRSRLRASSKWPQPRLTRRRLLCCIGLGARFAAVADPHELTPCGRLPRDDSIPMSRTAIPFDALIPPTDPVLVLARIPNHSHLHEQAMLSYTVTNTHSTIMDLAFQVRPPCPVTIDSY